MEKNLRTSQKRELRNSAVKWQMGNLDTASTMNSFLGPMLSPTMPSMPASILPMQPFVQPIVDPSQLYITNQRLMKQNQILESQILHKDQLIRSLRQELDLAITNLSQAKVQFNQNIQQEVQLRLQQYRQCSNQQVQQLNSQIQELKMQLSQTYDEMIELKKIHEAQRQQTRQEINRRRVEAEQLKEGLMQVIAAKQQLIGELQKVIGGQMERMNKCLENRDENLPNRIYEPKIKPSPSKKPSPRNLTQIRKNR